VQSYMRLCRSEVFSGSFNIQMTIEFQVSTSQSIQEGFKLRFKLNDQSLTIVTRPKDDKNRYRSAILSFS
jgi:hypothetical protein